MNETKSRAALRWQLPLFFLLGSLAYFPAAFVWCGWDSCGPPGTGESGQNPLTSVVFLVVGAIIAAIPLFTLPWHKSGRRRLVVGVVYAISLILIAIIWLFFSKGGW
jgi:hypothetical protein